MEIFNIKNMSFEYSGSNVKAISDINLHINKGEFVTICGQSGCGKTTLLRQMKPALTPKGIRTGSIFFEGKSLKETDERIICEKIGFVQQQPERQIVTDKVWHELAFGLENLGTDKNIIRKRVAETASFFGMETWFHKNVNMLSGGQKQLLNLASVMVLMPSVIILDEPSSQLDPIAAHEFTENLSRVNRELGTTVIITEHRLEDVIPVSTRLIVMDKGHIITDGEPKKSCEYLIENKHPMLFAMPSPVRIYAGTERISSADLCPVTIGEGRAWIENYVAENKNIHNIIKTPSRKDDKRIGDKNTAVSLRDVYFRYEKNSDDVIKGINLNIKSGEFVSIIGGNGAGKTTLLNLISGLKKPYSGNIKIYGNDIKNIKNPYKDMIGVLPQNPQALSLGETVLEMLGGISHESEIKKLTESLKLKELLYRNPFDLSGGEMQRAALARVLINNPSIILMDEPTKGLDADFKRDFAKIINKLKEEGKTIIMVSHDMDFCAEYSDSVFYIFDGDVISYGTPQEIFSENRFYTTGASRMAGHVIKGAVTVDEVVNALSHKDSSHDDVSYGDVSADDVSEGNISSDSMDRVSIQDEKTHVETFDYIKARSTEKESFILNLISFIMIFIAVPITIYIGDSYLNDRKYIFISFMILFECIFPFFLKFEKNSMMTRELVIIAVLSAIAVAGRAAFYMLPEFKPVLCITIIAGISMGKDAGFMVGALSMLVSNVFFGQGPWTPWQMFALGLSGFLAGVIFNKTKIGNNKIIVCIYGFLSAVLIYGIIMNTASAVMSGVDLSIEAVIAYEISGFPFDIIHAFATAVFLFASENLLTKKIKHSLNI